MYIAYMHCKMLLYTVAHFDSIFVIKSNMMVVRSQISTMNAHLSTLSNEIWMLSASGLESTVSDVQQCLVSGKIQQFSCTVNWYA